MFTLRCTKRFLARIRKESANAPARPPTTRLGDWYANTVRGIRPQLVVCVSERTSLPVVLPSAPASTFVERLRTSVAEMLRALSVPEEAIEKEMVAMQEVVIDRTASRHVLGRMNDYNFMVGTYLDMEHGSFLGAALRLAETLCKEFLGRSPKSMTRSAFEQWSDVEPLEMSGPRRART